MPGRPPTPIAVLKNRGTYRKDRHEGKLQPPKGVIGDPPAWYSREAKAEWKRITQDPVHSQIFADVHRGAVLEYCHLYGLMELEAQGKGKFTASQRQTLNSLRMQLGLTPSSSAKVNVPKAETESRWAAGPGA